MKELDINMSCYFRENRNTKHSHLIYIQTLYRTFLRNTDIYNTRKQEIAFISPIFTI